MLSQRLTDKIAKLRAAAAAAARQAKQASGRTAFGCSILAETLTNIATELEQLLPKRDLEAEAAISRLFRGWSEPEMRRRKLRRNRVRWLRRINDLGFDRDDRKAA